MMVKILRNFVDPLCMSWGFTHKSHLFLGPLKLTQVLPQGWGSKFPQECLPLSRSFVFLWDIYSGRKEKWLYTNFHSWHAVIYGTKIYTSWALWALWFLIFKARVLTWRKTTALSKSMAPATKSLIHVCLKVHLAAHLTSSFQSVYLENFHWLLLWRIILSKESSAKWLLYLSIVLHWNMLYESILLIILKMGIIILVLSLNGFTKHELLA